MNTCSTCAHYESLREGVYGGCDLIDGGQENSPMWTLAFGPGDYEVQASLYVLADFGCNAWTAATTPTAKGTR